MTNHYTDTTRQDELELEVTRLTAENEKLTAQLAQCYILSGADPDGDEDWRLATMAVAEVKHLREEDDESCEENLKLHEENERLLAANKKLTITLDDIYKAFLSRHGCFPLDIATEEQKQWKSAMLNSKQALQANHLNQRWDAERRVIEAAKTLWKSRKPIALNDRQYFENPRITASTVVEADLFEALHALEDKG